MERKVAASNLMSGSVAELPMKYLLSNLSDFDTLVIPGKTIAMPFLEPIPEKFCGTVHRIDTSDVHPGFARLRHDLSRICLNRSCVPRIENSTGPAITECYITCDELTDIASKLAVESKNTFRDITYDQVFAIHCPMWPKEADEWIIRKRNYQWPTKVLIEKAVRGGCHFVLKSHPNTPDDPTTFRFSFSFAETLLVRSWTDRQKYFYHILRVVKNELSYHMTKMDHRAVICTYTMKTLMLWACENKSPDFWIKRSYDSVIRELLCTLSGWLAKAKCPNYFIKISNMFDHFDETELNFATELVDAVIVNETQIQKMISSGISMNDATNITIFTEHHLILLLQLAMKRDSQFLISSQRDGQSALDRIVDDGEEFKNLFKAISTQRRIVELRNIISSGSGAVNRLQHFAEEKFRHAMAEVSQSCSEVTLDLSTSFQENILIILNQMQILARRLLKERVYSRDKITNVYEDANRNIMYTKKRNLPLELIVGTLIQTFADYFPKATYFVSAAYRSNYYFSCLEDYQHCLSVCDEAVERYDEANKKVFSGFSCSQLCAVVITSEWCSIFDECVQVSFGFLLLHKYLTKDVLEMTSRGLVVYMEPMAFVNYAQSQILVRLNSLLSKRQQEREQCSNCCTLLLNSIAEENQVLKGISNQRILRNFCTKAASEKLELLAKLK